MSWQNTTDALNGYRVPLRKLIGEKQIGEYVKEPKIMKMTECIGTSYEIGLQYGEAGQANLQKTLGMCLGNLAGFAKVTRNVELSREEILSTAGSFLSMTEAFDPELIEFVKGLAEGSGMSFQEAFYLRCAYDMLLLRANVEHVHQFRRNWVGNQERKNHNRTKYRFQR